MKSYKNLYREWKHTVYVLVVVKIFFTLLSPPASRRKHFPLSFDPLHLSHVRRFRGRWLGRRSAMLRCAVQPRRFSGDRRASSTFRPPSFFENKSPHLRLRRWAGVPSQGRATSWTTGPRCCVSVCAGVCERCRRRLTCVVDSSL